MLQRIYFKHIELLCEVFKDLVKFLRIAYTLHSLSQVADQPVHDLLLLLPLAPYFFPLLAELFNVHIVAILLILKKHAHCSVCLICDFLQLSAYFLLWEGIGSQCLDLGGEVTNQRAIGLF